VPLAGSFLHVLSIDSNRFPSRRREEEWISAENSEGLKFSNRCAIWQFGGFTCVQLGIRAIHRVELSTHQSRIFL
jgi:hypothetical protein